MVVLPGEGKGGKLLATLTSGPNLGPRLSTLPHPNLSYDLNGHSGKP